MLGEFVELSHYEAERYIEEIEPPDLAGEPLEFVGTPRWIDRHERLERLNGQAHLQAATRADEFVMDLFVTHEKVGALIADLIVTELWKANVFPLLKAEAAAKTSIKSYLPLYHEATVINLIEILFFHSSVAEGAGDAVVDLVDYCYRKMTHILTTPKKDLFRKKMTAKELGTLTPEQELTEQGKDIEFGVCMCAVSVLRFISDHRSSLPVSVTSRLLDKHDILLTLVPLMEMQPWARQDENGQLEKYEEATWQKVKAEDTNKLPKLQVQVWLTIFNLLMSQDCRNRYEVTHFRRENLLRLRRYLNEIVYDQIPPLVELHRCLEELSISGAFSGVTAVGSSPFIVEVVSALFEGLLQKYKRRWKQVAERQLKEVFVKETKEELKRLTQCISLPPELDPRCASCGLEASQRCSQCRQQWYCSSACQVSTLKEKDWSIHKTLCQVLVAAESRTLN